MGLRLRDCPSERFNWRDLCVIVRHSNPDSHLYKAVHPGSAGWTRTNMLLAEQVDVLHWLQWAKTKDGQRNRNRPKQVPRPGVGEPKQQRKARSPRPSPLSVIKARLGHREDPDRATKLKTLFAGR